MLISLKSANDRAKMLGYLCSYIHLHGNQSCICICKIPLCLYNLRSCYTCHFFHHIRQYLGDYYKNRSVTSQSKRRKYLHDISQWNWQLTLYKSKLAIRITMSSFRRELASPPRVCLKKEPEWEKAQSPKELPTKTRGTRLQYCL